MTIELRKILPGTSRQASYGIWVDNQSFPWTLVESYREYNLSVEAGQKGELIKTLPEDLTRSQAWVVLAKAEGARFANLDEQDAWIQETYPDEEPIDERDLAHLKAWLNSSIRTPYMRVQENKDA